MEYDTTKVDEVILALLHLNAQTDHGITRAWKGFDWDAMDRLHAQGFISDPNAMQLEGAMAGARTLGVQFEEVPVRGPDDFASALKALRGIDGVLNADNPFFVTHRVRLVDAVAGNRLPAIYPHRIYVEAGGLMSYGPNILDLWRRAAVYVDKILKGAKPGDLPVEQPTTFESVINNRAAKAIGLKIPPALVARADQIVE